jgi:hypothetical protein
MGKVSRRTKGDDRTGTGCKEGHEESRKEDGKESCKEGSKESHEEGDQFRHPLLMKTAYEKLTPAERWTLASTDKAFSLKKVCKLCGGPVLNDAKVLVCQPCRALQR